jgi:DNA-binding MarR family transcriptional regulator
MLAKGIKGNRMDPEKQEIEIFNDYRLWTLLNHTRFMIFRLRSQELEQFGLTTEQASILDILSQVEKPISISQIMSVTQRKHHSISVQIQRMSRQNLVTLVRNPQNSRRYEVAITRRGKTLLDEVSREAIPAVFGCRPVKAKEDLRAYLKDLLEKAYRLQSIERKILFKDE